jgi:hypothetical protein
MPEPEKANSSRRLTPGPCCSTTWEIGFFSLNHPPDERHDPDLVAHHHEPQRVSQSYFDVLAALTIAQSLVHVDDGSAFGGAVPADSRVNESYLISVKAPFGWSEAQRRVAVTTESEEVHHHEQ